MKKTGVWNKISKRVLSVAAVCSTKFMSPELSRCFQSKGRPEAEARALTTIDVQASAHGASAAASANIDVTIQFIMQI